LDLTRFARHELRLSEVKAMSGGRKYWGFAEGMFIAGNDDMIALRFLNGHGYESVTREIWKRCCRGAGLVADVGTHSGVFSLDAWRAGAQAVFSAEPHPINYSRLVMNLRFNGFDPSGCFFGAMGDVDRVGNLRVNGGLIYVHAAGRMDVGGGLEFPVRMRRLDSVILEAGWKDLAVVKIDAENFTPNVIDGMGKIFEAGHRPDLIIECIDGGMGPKLKSLGYKFWRIWETGRVEEVDDLVPHNPGKNYNGTDEDCRNRFASVRGLPD
jgi:FkbM family methyltransferase